MALGKQLPIRLESDVEKRLEAAAVKSGTTKSAIIRLLAKTFVDQVIGRDGTITMPPKWEQLLPVADRRAAKDVRSRPAKFVGEVHQLNCKVAEGTLPNPSPKKRAKKKQ